MRKSVTPKAATAPAHFEPDRFRWFVFPNRIREMRRERGFPRLLALSHAIPEISYIRLSKIERGEVFARTDELARIATALEVGAVDLLVDIDDPSFSISAWAEPFIDLEISGEAEERFAILLAAAVRSRRERDKSLTVSAIDELYGIPPVMLSRIENAFKTYDRWNRGTSEAICSLLGVKDAPSLRTYVDEEYQSGNLNPHISEIANAASRTERTRKRVSQLRAELSSSSVPALDAPLKATSVEEKATLRLRHLPVHGVPSSGGLIAFKHIAGKTVEAPSTAGARAFALRVCRPSLGMALPPFGVLIVDPDVFPSNGGLAVVREEGGYRLLAVSFDRDGALRGYSQKPDLEIDLDGREPSEIAAVVSVSLL